MIPWIAVLGLFPLVAGCLYVRRGRRWPELARIAILTLLALLAAAPLLTTKGLGTGEAYNYSLSIADAVTQMRAGTFPVFVGQSEYAFNGRIHPLRTAIYYAHAAGALDFVTGRQLGFWALQNLLLAASLFGAFFSAYACLRRVGTERPWMALILATLYGLSPGLLAPAYGMDLYMTVTAAPFVPIVLLGALRCADRMAFRHGALLAASLAATLAAHPPVAAWTALACAPLFVIGLFRQRSLRAVAVTALTALLGLALTAWSLASTLTLSDSIVAADNTANRQLVTQPIIEQIHTTGWAAFAPIQNAGAALGDFQLGYAGWALFIATLIIALRQRRTCALVLLLGATLLLGLTLPVPGLNRWLWTQLPAAFGAMTNSWPMQRAYLVVAALTVFAFAALSPVSVGRRPRVWLGIAGALLGGWTLWQASLIVTRAWHFQKNADETAQLYRPSNRDLTATSYAFLGLPDNYHAGARDLEQELRVVSFHGGRHVVADNLAAGGHPGSSGTLRITRVAGDTQWFLTPKIVLQPHTLYRLVFHPRVTPPPSLLFVSGGELWRKLPLLDPASKFGFGFGPMQTKSLPLWLDGDASEEIELSIVPEKPQQPSFEVLGDFSLEEIHRDELPIKLRALVPSLRADVQAAEDGWLETPRMYVPGYVGYVDGALVYPRRAADGRTLVPVPAGHHQVELRYTAPRLLRSAVWVSLGGWAALGLVALTRSFVTKHRATIALPATKPAERPGRSLVVVASTIITLIAAGYLIFFWRHPTGPARLRVALPLDAIGRAEPLLEVGDGPERVVAFVRYVDEETIVVGTDTTAAGREESDPIKVDFREPHEFTVSTGALFRFESTDATIGIERSLWLAEHARIALDGVSVLQVPAHAPRTHAAKPRLASATSRDGAVMPRFSGLLLQADRLATAQAESPIPPGSELRRPAGPLRLQVKLPAKEVGRCEPLLTIGHGPNAVCVFVHYIDASHLRVGVEGPNVPLQFSGPIPGDPRELVNFDVSHPDFFPPDTAAPRPGLAKLFNRVRVGVGGRWLINAELPYAARSTQEPAFERNPGVATYPGAFFSGQLLSVTRTPVSNWPLQSAAFAATLAPDAAGPLQLVVRLPRGMDTRTQPLLTAGQPGAGCIVMVSYVDATHVRFGVDVWNKALFWSEPQVVDYDTPQTIAISVTALFPSSAPALANLSAELREALRNQVAVVLNGRVVIHEKIFAYDAKASEITPGASLIGGSSNEALFLGDLLSLQRLPVK